MGMCSFARAGLLLEDTQGITSRDEDTMSLYACPHINSRQTKEITLF